MKVKFFIMVLLLSLATACTSPETSSMIPPEAAPTSVIAETAKPGPILNKDYDCSRVEHLSPDSAEAQKIVQEFVEDFKKQWPTEYMAMETLWAVDRLGEYAVILGGVTSDERDAIVVQQTPQGYQMVSRFIVTWGVSSRYTIPEYFAEQLPGAPPELFYCMDLSRLVENAPAQELDLNREYNCSVLEDIQVDSPEGQDISHVMLDFQKSGASGSPVELDEVRSIVRLEPYLAAQARFRVEGRPELPILFILEGSTGSYRVIGSFMGPTLSRKSFLREVYADVPDVQPELLECLELDWFFARPTPTPTTQASVALGRVAIAQNGDVLLKGLPEGETTSLAQLLGIDNVSALSRPRLSPSGAWLAFRLKEPDGWVFVHQIDGSGSYDLEESGALGLFTWSPVEDRLAYVAGQGELKLTSEYGSEPRSLVPQAGSRQITGLAWSPDGKWIAYSVGERKGSEDTYLGVWKVPVEGGESVELFASTDFAMDSGVYRLLGWTPDGQSLIFWEGNPYFSASLGADGLPLALVPAAGGEPVRLAESVLLYDDFVRPDPSGSGRIAVVVGGKREATEDKALHIFENGEGKAVSPAGYAASSPAWSPDGRYVAYAAMPEASNVADGEPLHQALMGRKLWLYDKQTGQSSQITYDPAYRDEYPLWSADGETLVFVRMDENDQVSLWSLDIHNGELSPLLDGLSTGGQGWFGYYGHIPWSEMMDWWLGR
jgi:WD40 repeat protein